MPEGLRHLRIFLSSPGDVPAERKIALEVIELLQYESQFKESVFFEVVAWDKPGAGTPMVANKTPQAAIDARLAMPAECDIVIVIFRARMGTPLPFPEYKKVNGEPYYSGAEWEFENAMQASRLHGRPDVLVYRCTEKVLLDDEAPDYEQKLAQKKLVKKFFDQFVDPTTGANLRGINFYEKPEDFRGDLTIRLRKLAEKLVAERTVVPTPYSSGSKAAALPPRLPDWTGSPFPGLRAFTDKDAPIFFGRGRETVDLLDRIDHNPFVTVVGALGSGKSSLVWAGLIPRLEAIGLSSAHRRLRVFLCHSSGDKPAVRDLHARLKADGFAPWLDEEELLPGQDWQHEIVAAVRACDVVIACLSQKSVNKEGYLQREIREALHAEQEKPEGAIFIVPVRLEEVDVPESLSKWQWADLFREKGYELLVRALRLRASAIGVTVSSGRDWLWLRLTPGGVGDNPFMAVAVELKPYLRREPRDIAQELAADPAALAQMTLRILSGRPEWAELLLFIDQLEELITVVAPSYRAPFAEMLRQAVAAERFRAVATLRADFYHQMIPVSPALVELLQNGSYPLGAPDAVSLYEMIVRPAERAGLQFEGDLAHCIVNDTGSEPGALALMAYLLDELYRRRTADGRLTLQAYEDLGRVAGAIGRRAEQVFCALSPAARDVLPHVFRRLVGVDKRGTATRQRALRADLERSAPAQELLKEFIKARLLVTDKQGENPTVEVAHEALLRKWGRLANWIEQTQDDLRLLRQVNLAAEEWDQNSRDESYRWPDERLKPVYEMIERLELDEEREFSPTERQFIRRESGRLLEEIENPDTPHIRRSWIGERLSMIGDPRPGVGLRPDGLPDIDWCKVELAGKSSVEIEVEKIGKVKVDLPFYIARYPVTFTQFQAFIEGPDGYHNRETNWFEGLAADDNDKRLEEQRFNFLNHPRETVNWYQAMAFCRWLSWRFEALKDSPSVSGMKSSNLISPSTWMSRSKAGKARGFDLLNPFTWAVCLPTEAEWQFAVAGPSAQTYPWGNKWDGRFANTFESGLGRSTAVGMYPAGAAVSGALDMSGNVFEWTLTVLESGKSRDITNQGHRVVRGGSRFGSQYNAHAAFRRGNDPGRRGHRFGGFRVVGVVPSP